MCLSSRCHCCNRGEGLEHGGWQTAHGLGWEVGCWGEGSGRHGGPLLLGSGENVGLTPDEWLTTGQDLGYRTQRRLDPKGQRRLSCECLLGPVPRRYGSHRHIT